MKMLDALLELATTDGIDVDTAVAISGLPSRTGFRRWLLRHDREDIWSALTERRES
jgi:hypothetical protein